MKKCYLIYLLACFSYIPAALCIDYDYFYNYDEYPSDEHFGNSQYWASVSAIRNDLSTKDQQSTSVVWISGNKSFLFNHKVLSLYVMDDDVYKQDIKKQLNWTGSDKAFKSYLLNLKIASDYPDDVEFKQIDKRFTNIMDRETILITNPHLSNTLNKRDKTYREHIFITGQMFSVASIGFIEFSFTDVMYSLLEHETYVVKADKNKMYDIQHGLKV